MELKFNCGMTAYGLKTISEQVRYDWIFNVSSQFCLCHSYSDLYHSWVAPTLQSNLLVQFWRRSTGILPSDCSQNWKVLNVDLISPGQRVTFKATADHSKWAISTNGGYVGTSGSWVCVGDINRDEAEEKRGGGTVCHRDAMVWKAYRTAALQCETCDGKVQTCDKAVWCHWWRWVHETLKQKQNDCMIGVNRYDLDLI